MSINHPSSNSFNADSEEKKNFGKKMLQCGRPLFAIETANSNATPWQYLGIYNRKLKQKEDVRMTCQHFFKIISSSSCLSGLGLDPESSRTFCLDRVRTRAAVKESQLPEPPLLVQSREEEGEPLDLDS